MKNLFIKILLMTLVFIPSVSMAMTLKGGVEKIWTVDSAREEAFKDLKEVIDLSSYPAIDQNLIENKKLINKKQFNNKGRKIVLFSKGVYAVRYNDNISESYYYNSGGKLLAIEYVIYAQNIYTKNDVKDYPYNQMLYPSKRYRHAYPTGKIIGVGLSPKYMDDYLFEPTGELRTHCIGKNCYDANNNFLQTRSD